MKTIEEIFATYTRVSPQDEILLESTKKSTYSEQNLQVVQHIYVFWEAFISIFCNVTLTEIICGCKYIFN